MQTRHNTPPQSDTSSPWSHLAGLGCLALLTCLILQGITLLLSALPPGAGQRGAQPVGSQSLSSPALPSFAASASIIPLHTPGGPADGAAYVPSDLSVPAQSLVTLTIRNYDLGDTPLPAT